MMEEDTLDQDFRRGYTQVYAVYSPLGSYNGGILDTRGYPHFNGNINTPYTQLLTYDYSTDDM